MNSFDRHGALLAAFVGGFVAVLSSRLSLGYDSVYAEQSGVWFAQFVTPQWAGSVTVVVALFVLLGLHARDSAKLVASAAVASPVVIALPTVVPLAGNQALSVTSVGAGLLLAAAAVIASGSQPAQLGLMVGVLAAVLFSSVIRAYLPIEEGRWMIEMPPGTVESTIPPLILTLVGALLVTVALRTVSLTAELNAQVVVVMLGLVFAYLLDYVFLGSATSSTPMWVFAAVLACGFTVVAARLLARSDGNVVLVGFAVAATSVSSLAWSDRSWWVALIGLLVLIVAAWLGYRTPRMRMGFVLLAGVAASGLLTGTAWFGCIATVAYAVVFPAAVGLCLGSCVPIGIAASLVGPVAPLSMTLLSVSAPSHPAGFYWTSAAEEIRYPVVATVSPLFVSVVVATVAVVIAGVASSPRAAEPA